MMGLVLAVVAAPRQDGSQLEEYIDTSSVTGWDVVIALLILALSYPVASAVSWIVGRVTRRSKMTEMAQQLFKRLAGTIVVIIFVAIAVSLLGASVEWFTIVMVLIGLIAVLMLRPLIENFSAGLLLEVRGSFVVGDEIDSNGHEGEVRVINGRTTVLETRDGRRVAIPSTDVLDNTIVIYSAFEKRRSSLTVHIDYRADLDAAVAALEAAASSAEGVLDDPAPSVRARGFGNGTYELELRWWHGPRLSDESMAQDQVVRHVKAKLDAAGISMPSPVQVIRQPDVKALPGTSGAQGSG